MFSLTQKLAVADDELRAANARAAAFEARAVAAAQTCREQRDEITALSAQIEVLTHQLAGRPSAPDRTWTYTRRDGSVWQVARINNRVTSWQCPQAE